MHPKKSGRVSEKDDMENFFSMMLQKWDKGRKKKDQTKVDKKVVEIDAEYKTWISKVQGNWKKFAEAPSRVCDAEEVVCAAVRRNPKAFEYASNRLKNDKEFFLEKIIRLTKKSPKAFQFASDEIKNDGTCVRIACQHNYRLFYFASERLRDDKEFVVNLLQQKKITSLPPSYALLCASDRLKNDKDVVIEAIQNSENLGGSLRYASEELRNDKQVVKIAVSNFGMSLKFAGQKLILDHEFCSECVKIDRSALGCVPEVVKKNEKFQRVINQKQKKKLRKGDKDDFFGSLLNKLRKDEKKRNPRKKKIMIDPWIKKVKMNWKELENAPTGLTNYEEVVCAAVNSNFKAFKFVPDSLRNNKKFFVEKILPLSLFCESGGSYNALQFTNEEIKNDKEVVKMAVRYNSESFQYASDELKGDKKFFLELVQEMRIDCSSDNEFSPANALEHASTILRNDKEVVKMAAMYHSESFQYASDELKGDKNFVLALVREKKIVNYMSDKFSPANALKHASTILRNDEEVVYAAVKNVPTTFMYASDRLKNDKEFFTEKVIPVKNFCALEYAGNEIKNDRKCVKMAVHHYYHSFNFASKELRNDKDFLYELFQLVYEKMVNLYHPVRSFQYASTRLRGQKDVVLKAVSILGDVLKDACKELRNDKEVVLVAVENSDIALLFASEELRNDREVVLVAIKSHCSGGPFKYASKELRNDKDFVMIAVNFRGGVLKYASKELRNDKELVLAAMGSNYALEHASETIRSDREVLKEALAMDGYNIKFATEELKKDKEFWIRYVRVNEGDLNRIGVPGEFKKDDAFLKKILKQTNY